MEAHKVVGIGHNSGSDEENIHRQLEVDYDDILMLYESTLKKESTVPTEVTDDDSSGKVADYIKKLSSVEKMLDASRKAEKEKYDTKSKAVHSFFKKRMETVDKVIEKFAELDKAYKQRKADEKRRQDEEKARLAKEEAERKLREAQEAQRVAEEARRKAEEDAANARRKAEEDRIAAEKAAAEARAKAEAEAAAIRKKAEDEAAAARADADRIRAESAAKEEEGRRAQQAAERAAKEKEAEAARIAKLAERAAQEREEAAERTRKEAERAARQVEREAEERALQAQRDVKAATREANKTLDEAVRADKYADKLERKADASLADLSRTRGDHSVSSISTHWQGEVVDRASLNLETLRPFLPLDALNQAVNAYVRAGGRQLAGARIWEEIKSQVR